MSSPLRILCLENDLADAELLQDTLETEGIACKLTRVEAECDFRAAVQQGGFDLILADYTLPSFDGLSALRIVRQQLPDVPFIFVSGTLGEEVAIEALKMGATDYVFKTRLSRLVPAIHRATREAEEIAELRRSEEILREQANLLNLTHDTIFVMDMEGVIKYWNHGAEEQYGWAAEEALGKVVHDLLKTAFPIPLEEIKTDVIRKGRWEGELVHTKRDGRHVVVATRWSLQRDEQGTPIAILELNNDVTERKRAEEELREGETRFRTFVDHAGDAFFVLDQQQQGRVVDVNRQACESLGYTREELIGMALHDFDPDVDAAMLQGIRERIVAEGVCTFETRHRRKDGTTFPVEVRVRPLWHGGRPFHLALARDITERKRTEEALCRLNRELRAISNCNQTLLRATDEQSLLKEICRIVCEEAGYRLAWVGYAEHDDAKTVRPVAWAGVEDGYLATVNVSWADTERGQGPGGTAIRSGELVYFQDSTTDPRFAPWRESALQRGYRSGIVLPLKDEHANAFGCLCIYSAQSDAFTSEEIRLLEELAGDMAFGIVTLRSRDARKRAEEEVRNTAAQWQATFDAVQDLVLLLDKDFRILRANHAAAEFLGLPFDKIVGGHCYDLTHATSTPPAECPLAKMRQSRRHEEAEVLAGKGGPWLSVSVDPLFDPSGELTQVVHVARDITERKRAEDALRQSEAYLAEAQRLSHTGSWAFDVATGNYIYWSEELFRIFGFDPQEGVGTLEEVIRRFHPEDLNRWKENFERSLREKVDTSCECRFVMPDGTVKRLHLVRHPVLNDAGEVVQLVGTTMDITDRKRAEEALRRSEAYLKEAQRLSHTGSWAFDLASNKYVYLSEECLGIFELDAQQDLPTREAVSRLIHREDWGRVNEDFEKSVREKVDILSEFRIALPSGTTKHIQAIRHPVLNDAGELVELVGTVIDMTERKRAEEALRRSEAYLTEAQRLSHTGSWSYDLAGGAIYWSEEMFRIYAMDPQQGPPTRAQRDTRLHPEDLENVRQARHKLLHKKVDTEFEHRIVLPDGKVRHVHVRGHPVLNPAGEVLETVGTTVDITDRKRAEQELREGETRFRTFVDHAGDALFVYDLEQKTVVDVNREACKSLGYTRQELIGKTPLAFHLDSKQAHMESIAERAVSGETVFDTHWHLRKDGTVFPVEVHTTLVSYTDRRFLLMVARDISDRLQAEEQRKRLRQLEADMAHIARVSMMGELAASIAHEVNQPLSGIVSSGGACLRWLAADPPNLEEVREAVRRIVGAGKHAGEVIARIRALTKRTAAPKERLDLNETIREVLPLVGDEAKRNKVMIRTQFADDASPIFGDQVQLQQVVLNLVMNGIEAMSSVGERERELVITTRNIDPDQVQVTVEDSGIGIDPNTIQKIFDPFYTTKSTGMGMGLSISRSILQYHGGRLWATAKDGPGTSFHFTLPKYHEEESNAGV